MAGSPVPQHVWGQQDFEDTCVLLTLSDDGTLLVFFMCGNDRSRYSCSDSALKDFCHQSVDTASAGWSGVCAGSFLTALWGKKSLVANEVDFNSANSSPWRVYSIMCYVKWRCDVRGFCPLYEMHIPCIYIPLLINNSVFGKSQCSE